MSEALAIGPTRQPGAGAIEIMQRIPERGLTTFELGTTIDVPAGQVAVLYRDGRALAVLEPGQRQLTLKTMPALAELDELTDGNGERSFRAALLFLNCRPISNLRWGTRNPIVIHDRALGAVRVRGHGSYSLRLTDPARFTALVSGRQAIQNSAGVEDLLRDVIVARFDIVARESVDSLIDLSERIDEITRATRRRLEVDLRRYGIELLELELQALTLPDEAAIGIELAELRARDGAARIQLASDARVGTLLSRVRVRSLQDQRTTAAAAGGAAHPPGPRGPQAPASAVTVACGACEAAVPEGSRFCPWCGHRRREPS